MKTKPESPYEYQQRKAKEKRLATMYTEFPNQKGATILQGGTSKTKVTEVHRPAPGVPLTLPNGMPLTSRANPEVDGQQSKILSDNGESNLPTASDFYDLK
jgi:hypothetical protein